MKTLLRFLALLAALAGAAAVAQTTATIVDRNIYNDATKAAASFRVYDNGDGTFSPVLTQDVVASGNITTQNLVPAGTATANSAVEVGTNGLPNVTVQVTGTYTGALSAQATVDGTNWITLSGLLNVNTGANAATISSAANGIFQIESAGFQKVRVTGLAAMTGTAVITLRASVNPSQVALDAPVPTGTNTIGSIASIGTSVTPGTAAANLGKAEDAVAASGDTGVFALGVRRDAATASASAAGDYQEITTNRFGAVYTAGFRTSTRTYSATGNVTVAATATDIAAIFGNATTTVAVTKIRITGIQTTTGTPELLLIVRSTANSGGTSSSMSVAKHEQADSANNSTPIVYTANPTPGTAAGTIRRFYLPVGSAASGLSQEFTMEFGDNGKPIILSGTAQGLVLNLNSVTVTGGVFNITLEWYEF